MHEVRSAPIGHVSAAAPRAVPVRRILAVVVQLASYLTTLWAVQWVWNDGTLVQHVIAAAVLEFLLVGMKGALWAARGRDQTLGWAGFLIDAAINTGGILPRSARLLTWPPLAALLSVIGVNAADPATQAGGSLLLALAGGILLSILPHRLWRD